MYIINCHHHTELLYKLQHPALAVPSHLVRLYIHLTVAHHAPSQAHLAYLEVLRHAFGPASVGATPADTIRRLSKGARRLLRVVDAQLKVRYRI